MHEASAARDHRRLAAIMFTDIVGYSALTQRDEALALSLLKEHNRILRTAIAAHRGNEIKTVGDAFLVEFASALDAVQCAIAAQSEIRTRNASHGVEPFQIRIGIHLGDIVFRDGDVFGDGVNIAARIEAEAPAGGVFVSEDVSRQVKNKLGLLLREIDKRNLKNIETPVAIYEVQLPWMVNAFSAPPVVTSSRLKMFLRWGGTALVLIVVGSGGWMIWRKVAAPAADIAKSAAVTPTRSKSIAVLPFANLSGNKEDEYFGDGITEDLLTQLAQLSDLKVISRTSVMQYKDTKKSMREIARELGVTNILEGSVRRTGDRFRINAQLIDAERDEHLWAKTYDREIRDVLAVQTDVTTEIAGALKAKLLVGEKSLLERHAMGNAEAYVSYMKGLHLLRVGRDTTLEGLILSRQLFEKSVELDPQSPLGYTGLAAQELSIARFKRLPPMDAAVRAEKFIQRALELNDRSPEALLMLARIRGLDQWNWREAESLAKRAIEINPGSADAWALYAAIMEPSGRLDEALVVTQRAVALDPRNIVNNYRIAFLLYALRRFDDAITESRAALQFAPNAIYLHYIIAQCLEQQKKFKEAIAAHRLAMNHFMPDASIDDVERAFDRDGEVGYWRSRYVVQQKWAINQKADSNYFLAMSAAAAGETDDAFKFLDKAIALRDRNVTRVKVEPSFDAIRSDIRYPAILARLNLG